MFTMFKSGMAAADLEIAIEEVLGKGPEVGKMASEIVGRGAGQLKHTLGKDYKNLDPLVVATYSLALDTHRLVLNGAGSDYVELSKEIYLNLSEKIKTKYFVEKPTIVNQMTIDAAEQTFTDLS